MGKLIPGLLAAAMLIGAAGASAQTPAVPTRDAVASITIPSLLHIDVTNLNVAFASPSFADFDSGWIVAPTASVIDTRANVVHDVTIQAAAATMTGPYAKPASDLRWSADGWTTDNGLTNGAVDVLTALSRGAHAAAATVEYRMLLDEALDVPGSYSLDFTYTVVAN